MLKQVAELFEAMFGYSPEDKEARKARESQRIEEEE